MRIKKAEILSFGKFRNYKMDFSDGFNVIFGSNEDGKSTLAAFICLMLYGTAGTNSRTDISGNLRKKYAPWSGEKMSGSMEIECGGRSFLIYKEFRQSSKTDKVKVIDTETGDEIHLAQDMEIGEYFLDIDRNAFEKSIFGGNGESFAGKDNGDIVQRLSNLSESGDESVSMEKVMKRIDSAMDSLVKKRGKGKIDLLRDRNFELTQLIEAENRRAGQREALREEYGKTEEELKTLNEKMSRRRLIFENREKKRLADLYRTLAKISDEILETEKDIERLTKGGNADEILAKCEYLKKDTEIKKELLSKAERPRFKNNVREEDMERFYALTDKKRSINEEAKKRKFSFRLGLIFGAFLFFGGVVGGIFTYPLFLLSFAGILTVILSTAGIKSAEKKCLEAEKNISELFSSLGCASAEEFEKAYREEIAFLEKEKLYLSLSESCDKAENDYISFVNGFEKVSSAAEAERFTDYLSQLTEKKKSLMNREKAYRFDNKIEEINSEKLILLAKELEKALPCGICEEELPVSEEEIKLKNERLLEIRGLIGAETENLGDLERELSENKKLLAEMESYYEDLSLAKDVFLEAEDEMRRTFAPELKKRASEIFCSLTGGKYEEMNVDKSFEISVKTRENGFKERHYLSRGTCAQSYLALRIAVCEMLAGNESIPILLDDVLADYDDERADRALEFFDKCGKQILLFTCHKNMCNFGQKHNI